MNKAIVYPIFVAFQVPSFFASFLFRSFLESSRGLVINILHTPNKAVTSEFPEIIFYPNDSRLWPFLKNFSAISRIGLW